MDFDNDFDNNKVIEEIVIHAKCHNEIEEEECVYYS